jgi:hypothetical protein
MRKEIEVKELTKTLVLLSRTANLVKDKFFFGKFRNKISELIASYMFIFSEREDNVAQYEHLQKTIGAIKELEEFLDDMFYLKLLKTSPLSLKTYKSLLEIKLAVINKEKGLRTRSLGKVEEKFLKTNISDPPIPMPRPVKNPEKFNFNRQKILDFIKSYPNLRTKEIIREFNALSDRTVKRNLNELLRIGAIKKRSENKAVYYSATG